MNKDELADLLAAGPSLSRDEFRKRMEKAKRMIRASHGQLDVGTQHSHSGLGSFRGDVDLSRNPGRSHTLASHFVPGTGLYEYVRKLVWWAQKYPRPDNFVFPSIDGLYENFRKGSPQNKEQRSLRAFWECARQACELGVTSPRIRIDGHDGWIIAPHDALCMETLDGKLCRWVGPNYPARNGTGYFKEVVEHKIAGWKWYPGAPEFDHSEVYGDDSE